MLVRVAGAADIVAIQLVSHAAGQSGAGSGEDAEYVRLLLETATVRVAADESDGIVSGWGAVRSGPLGSLLTDLFVHPSEQGLGIGGHLLRTLWPDRDAPGRFTFSSQHANALPVYLPLRAGASLAAAPCQRPP
jgi:GNAT superfamily N-acetyltransferase